jgi:hypothetical protein
VARIAILRTAGDTDERPCRPPSSGGLCVPEGFCGAGATNMQGGFSSQAVPLWVRGKYCNPKLVLRLNHEARDSIILGTLFPTSHVVYASKRRRPRTKGQYCSPLTSAESKFVPWDRTLERRHSPWLFYSETKRGVRKMESLVEVLL